MKAIAFSAEYQENKYRIPILFRTYVSRNAAGKARAVLEGVGLDTPTIAACFGAHLFNDEETVQDGLIKWLEGKGRQPPTWKVLFDAMDYAGIAQQHVAGLRKELDQIGMYSMLFVLVHLCALCMHVHACRLALT